MHEYALSKPEVSCDKEFLPLYDVGKQDGAQFLLMECVDGDDAGEETRKRAASSRTVTWEHQSSTPQSRVRGDAPCQIDCPTSMQMCGWFRFQTDECAGRRAERCPLFDSLGTNQPGTRRSVFTPETLFVAQQQIAKSLDLFWMCHPPHPHPPARFAEDSDVVAFGHATGQCGTDLLP